MKKISPADRASLFLYLTDVGLPEGDPLVIQRWALAVLMGVSETEAETALMEAVARGYATTETEALANGETAERPATKEAAR